MTWDKVDSTLPRSDKLKKMIIEGKRGLASMITKCFVGPRAGVYGSAFARWIFLRMRNVVVVVVVCQRAQPVHWVMRIRKCVDKIVGQAYHVKPVIPITIVLSSRYPSLPPPANLDAHQRRFAEKASIRPLLQRYHQKLFARTSHDVQTDREGNNDDDDDVVVNDDVFSKVLCCCCCYCCSISAVLLLLLFNKQLVLASSIH